MPVEGELPQKGWYTLNRFRSGYSRFCQLVRKFGQRDSDLP